MGAIKKRMIFVSLMLFVIVFSGSIVMHLSYISNNTIVNNNLSIKADDIANVISVFSLATTIFFSSLQVIKLQPIKRTRLKLDIDILNGIGDDHPRYYLIKGMVDSQVESVYRHVFREKHHFKYWDIAGSDVYNPLLLGAALLAMSIAVMYQLIIINIFIDKPLVLFWAIIFGLSADVLIFKSLFLFAFHVKSSATGKPFILKDKKQLSNGIIGIAAVNAYVLGDVFDANGSGIPIINLWIAVGAVAIGAAVVISSYRKS